MKLHGNAALSWRGRRCLAERVVVEGWTLRRAAEAAGVSVRCARKWVGRYRLEGELGLLDRSSAPRRVANRTAPERLEAIAKLRRLRFTAAEIAETLEMALSTVSGILTRSGMGRLGRLGLEPAVRYERSRSGELLHLDVKKLGRIIRPGHRVTGSRRDRRDQGKKGWEYVHIAIDDYSRLAYAEVLDDETALTIVAFLRRAVAFYERHGVRIERLLTDNGSGYRSTIHALACKTLGIRHSRTRPYRPQTNGKAERFIRTLLNGWAYGAIYRTSSERTAALDGWLWHYNHHRKHSALGHQPPDQQNQPAQFVRGRVHHFSSDAIEFRTEIVQQAPIRRAGGSGLTSPAVLADWCWLPSTKLEGRGFRKNKAAYDEILAGRQVRGALGDFASIAWHLATVP